MDLTQRKPFKEWIVREVYIRQDGVCLRCGNSLAKGFHRHHADGDSSNNDPSNLQLLCPDCHYQTFKSEQWNEHKELERNVMVTLHQALHKALEKKLSGAALERMILVASKVLSISRHEKGLVDSPERLPELYPHEGNLWAEGYKDGIKRGIELGIREVEG